MKKIMIVSMLLISSLMLNAELNHRGFVRTYFGSLVKNGDYSISQNTFDWKLNYTKGDVGFYVNPVFNYNTFNNKLGIKLRQSYFDIFFKNFDMRIGKQQIIWGKADGVFITDVISPRDLSEFILPEFEEIRIGINAVKLDYYLGNSTIETVLIPIFQPTILPDENSIWSPQKPKFPITPTFEPVKNVENKLSSGEAALKYSYLGSAIDFDLMTAYMWDDNPAMYIYPRMNPDTGQPTELTIKPTYHRLPLVGASFGKSILGAVIRGEAAYYFGKKFSAEDFSVNGIKEKNYLNYLLGYDHNWWGVNVSMQFIQEYILDYEKDIRNDKFQSTMTFLTSKTFINETLELNLFSYYEINNKDTLLRPKISYDFSDGFNILFGADIFLGDKGNFGQYNNNDMIYTKIRFDF